MRQFLYTILCITIITNVNAQEIRKLGIIKSGSAATEFEWYTPGVPGEQPSPTGFFINEYDKTVSFNDSSWADNGKRFKTYDLFSGTYKHGLKIDYQNFNELTMAVQSFGKYYLRGKQFIYTIDKSGQIDSQKKTYFVDWYIRKSPIFLYRNNILLIDGKEKALFKYLGKIWNNVSYNFNN